jgi:hypothetical protein
VQPTDEAARSARVLGTSGREKGEIRWSPTPIARLGKVRNRLVAFATLAFGLVGAALAGGASVRPF